MIKAALAETLESNKEEFETHGKLDQELLQKVNYKIRLDWNYYSNRMEGGTLTRAETRNVMVGIGVTKPIKDVTEMDGHDQVVLDILSMAAGKMRLSEKRIKDIHKAIMHESDKGKQKQIGQWKTEANEIINYKNEKVRFTEPGDVAEEMHQLLNWLNTQIDHFHHPKKTTLHPVEIAAKFHLDYVSIHPFYDGNGRTARLLTNLILISFDYPPIIIKDEHKKPYYNLLGDIQSYGGKPDLFFDFVAERVIDTQELYLKAIAGEEIGDEDDLDKRLKLLDQKFEAIPEENEVKVIFSDNVFDDIIYTWVLQLLKIVLPKSEKFDRYFVKSTHIVSIPEVGASMNFSSKTLDNDIDRLRDFYKKYTSHFPDRQSTSFRFLSRYEVFKKGGIGSIGCNYGFKITFNKTSYTVSYNKLNTKPKGITDRQFTKKLLSEPLTVSEMSSLAMLISNATADHVELAMKAENRKNTEE
ncbi:MAG: Fic family protein [Vicingaceae bacterium]